MTPVRFIFIFLLSTILILPCWSQIESNPWSFPKFKQALSTSKNFPQQHTIVQLEEEILREILKQAPLRFSKEAKLNKTILTLPLGDGTLQEFIIEEAPVLHPDLRKKYPNIRSYAGQSIADPTTTVRFSWSPKGIQALIIASGQTSVIDTYNSSNNNHIVYNRKDRIVANSAFECTVRRHEDRQSVSAQSRSRQAGDCQLRTYRLAVACTGEYTGYHGGTTADALAAINASITRINGVFENDLAVSLQLIPNNTDIIFLNPNTDPYNNFDGFEMLDQNQETIDRIIGSSNYDIGHIFSTWGGGGVAELRAVCNSRTKAQGVTGSGEPEGDFFDIDFVAHEFGHQFGAQHTFNGTRESCGGNNRWLPSAVEPGGGTTIMGYAGICGSQNIQNQSDVYFHSQSIEEINNFLLSDGNGCAQLTNLNNEGPIADAGPDFIIPISTPFVLKGESLDTDGGALTYTWEQLDTESSAQPPVSTSIGGPLFRSNPPTSSIERFFPDLSFLANNLDHRWEVLPSVDRELNFRFTVRDNNIGGGCTGEDDMNIVVNDQAGPFLVLSPNTNNITWLGGAKETVTWDEANTSAGPINAALVDILLSIDGGLSFTETVLTNVPNTGTAEIIVPNIATNEARIMVRASENIFFDISNQNFTIEPIRDDFFVTIDESSKETCSELSTTYNVNVDVSGILDGSVSLSTSGLPAGITASFSNNNFIPPNNVILTLTPDATILPATYDFIVNVTGTTGTQTRDLSLTIVNESVEVILDTPTNNNNSVEPTATFAWNVVQGTEKYTLQIATDVSFTAPITYTDLTNNIFSIPISLSTNTRYFWKVIAEGPCLSNKESAIFTFLTSSIACKIYDSEDVPIEISREGRPTISSIINIPDEGIITDVNVLNLQIDHTFVSDIAVALGSPEDDIAVLLFFPCFFEENVDISFDDEATNSFESIPCPPADGGLYNSMDELSVFDGSSVNGDWVLIVTDDAEDDGGSLNSWSLEVCFLQESLVAALSINAEKTDETCFGSNDGTASVNVFDGTGNYTFLWSNGATNANIDNLVPGTYTVTVSDGVTDIVDSMTIAAAPEIVRSFDIINQSCSDTEDGQITALAVDLDYLWPDGSTGTTFSSLVSGSYEVAITDTATGCSTSEILEISAPDPIQLLTVVENASCPSVNDARILPEVFGGTPPYITNANELINLAAGDYIVFVTDANNCSQSEIITVLEPSPITIDFSSNPISRVGATDGFINATVSGGNGPYTFDWSNSLKEASINDLAEGVYELTVTDQNNCRKIESTVVAGIDCAVISITLDVEEITMVDGNDGFISAPINNDYTYAWSTGDTSAAISSLVAGTYSVTITDGQGCTGTQTAVLNGVRCTPFSIDLNTEQITEIDGADGSISASIENGQETYTYLWSTGETTATISNLPVGTYSVTVTDEKGCTGTQAAVLNEIDCRPFALDFFIERDNGPDGSTISVFVDGEGTFSFLWSTGDTTATISNLSAGSYGVTVKDEEGCTATEIVEIIDCSSVNVSFDVIESNCGEANGRISAIGGSSNSYTWSTGSMDSAISNLSTGITYSVTVTNGPECSRVLTFQLGEEKDTTSPIIDCPEDRIITNACNLPVNYDIVTSDDCGVTQMELLQGLESGVEFPQGETFVEYMAADAAGNMATCSFMVTQVSDMSLEYDPTFLIENVGDQIVFAFDLRCSNPNEAIKDFVTVNGGVPPFTFEALEVSNGGAATVYLVNVTDAAGCILQEEVNFLNINETEDLISPILEVAIKDVSTGLDGGIEVEIDDRFGIVSYTWTRDNTLVSTNQNLENVAAGNYVLKLTDQFGCTYTSDYEVQMLTSTNQLLLEETVQLMPNPNTGNFQIRITLPNPVSVSIELYDVNGRLLQPAIKRDNSDLPIDININNFSKGIYFTKISAEQEVIVKRVVLL